MGRITEIHEGIARRNRETLTPAAPAGVRHNETRIFRHGVAVHYFDGPSRWYYAVTTDDGAEIEEGGYTDTKAEATELARVCRDSLAYRS